jgi:hypothetical protein
LSDGFLSPSRLDFKVPDTTLSTVNIRMESKMKKTITLMAVFASLSSGMISSAYAQFMGNNQAPYGVNQPDSGTVTDTAPLAGVDVPAKRDVWLMGRYGMTKDPDDIRRWEER